MCCCCCCCCRQVASVVSNSVRPQRRQPTRLPRPWDSPGKNTGVGCHFLLQCMKVKSESEVAQSYPSLRDPMDCSLPGSSIHGIFQTRVLEWVAIAFSDKCAKGRFTIIFLLFFKAPEIINVQSFKSISDCQQSQSSFLTPWLENCPFNPVPRNYSTQGSGVYIAAVLHEHSLRKIKLNEYLTV